MIKDGKVTHPFVWEEDEFPALTEVYRDLTKPVEMGKGKPGRVVGVFLSWALPILEHAAQNGAVPPEPQPPQESQSLKNLRKWAE